MKIVNISYFGLIRTNVTHIKIWIKTVFFWFVLQGFFYQILSSDM